jgi:Cu(I)/Ag(I) efflux system membrane fusion protein
VKAAVKGADMNKTRHFVLPGILILLAAAFYIGLRVGGRSGPEPAAGDAPAGPGRTQDSVEASADISPSAVHITPEKQRMIGVRVGVVEKKPFVHTLRVFGRVAADETKVYRLTASVDGWINDSFGYPVGSQVRKGAVLATFYSQQFLDAQQAFIYALDAGERLQTGQRIELSRSDIPLQAALDKRTIQRQIDQLRSLGMDDSQIEEIGRTRSLTQSVRIVAPAGGFVLVRDVSPGQRFARGDELFRIADLSRVWILADVFENEAPYFKPGVEAAVRLPYRPEAYRAVTSRALPVFDAGTRTLKVRLETPNPDFALRPDMFADVELPLTLDPALTLPADAVIRSGRRTTVFVERGEGVFEPRAVETGWRLGGRVEIVSGLSEGEKVALSGVFLLDSESRLQSIAQGVADEPDREPTPDHD